MQTTRIPTFSSPELQKAVADAQPVLEGVDEARNRVSNDIKALEGYLRGFDLKSSFRYPLGKCFVSNDHATAAAIEYGGTADGGIEEEALIWGESAGGNVRLLYEQSRWNGYVDIDGPGGPLFWEDETLDRESKPLIETKFEIRKRMYHHLPAFVAALAKHFDIDPDSRTAQDDVPF